MPDVLAAPSDLIFATVRRVTAAWKKLGKTCNFPRQRRAWRAQATFRGWELDSRRCHLRQRVSASEVPTTRLPPSYEIGLGNFSSILAIGVLDSKSFPRVTAQKTEYLNSEFDITLRELLSVLESTSGRVRQIAVSASLTTSASATQLRGTFEMILKTVQNLFGALLNTLLR